MYRLFVAFGLALTPVTAFAQQPSPAAPFVPWTMTEQDVNNLQQYLNAQPFGVVAPIVQFLGQREKDAQDAAAKAGVDAPKPTNGVSKKPAADEAKP